MPSNDFWAVNEPGLAVKLVFDLDGTLIDSRQRLHTLFQQLVPMSDLSLDSYWALKRAKVTHEDLLRCRFGFDSAAVERFVADWMRLIESPDLLDLDTVLPGVDDALSRLAPTAALYVCTARQRPQAAFDQLERLGMLHHFTTVMVTARVRSKRELIASIPDLAPGDWFLTDTGRDIRVGQALKMRTCAVLSGFLSEASLRPYRPDLVLPSVADFHPLIHMYE